MSSGAACTTGGHSPVPGGPRPKNLVAKNLVARFPGTWLSIKNLGELAIAEEAIEASTGGKSFD